MRKYNPDVVTTGASMQRKDHFNVEDHTRGKSRAR